MQTRANKHTDDKSSNVERLNAAQKRTKGMKKEGKAERENKKLKVLRKKITFLRNGKQPLSSLLGGGWFINKSGVGVLLGPNTFSSLKHSVSIICKRRRRWAS